MAQRNSPSRRIPGDPLAGILRTMAYQARYSNRRRSDVPTVTNSAAAAESAEAAAGVSVASLSGPSLLDVAAAGAMVSQLSEPVATSVATGVVLPSGEAATLMVDADGRATWQYEDRGSVPHVAATVVADQPAVATVAELSATAATLRVWDLSGQPVAGVTVCVAAYWP